MCMTFKELQAAAIKDGVRQSIPDGLQFAAFECEKKNIKRLALVKEPMTVLITPIFSAKDKTIQSGWLIKPAKGGREIYASIQILEETVAAFMAVEDLEQIKEKRGW